MSVFQHHKESYVEMLVKEPEIQNLINDTSNTSKDALLIVAIKWEVDLAMIHLLTKAGADWNKAVYENKIHALI